MNFTKLAATVAISLIAATTAAVAAPAVVTTQLNVREGPGTDYRVLDVLYRGEVVEVERCRGTWCFVDKQGPNGWVSAKYLSAGRYHDDDDDDFSFGVYIGGNDRYYEPEPEPEPLTRYPTLNPDGSPIYGDTSCYEGPFGLVCY